MSQDAAVVIDDFELINCIATGGTCQIWEVSEKGSNRRLAMKLLLADSQDLAANKAALKKEADIYKVMDHPNVVRFFKYASSKKGTYILMEYVKALNVKAYLKVNRTFLHARAPSILEGITLAVTHVHSKNWVHRDLKPDNILVSKAGEVKLCDFSLASRPVSAFASMMGSKGVIQGTRSYIAPETIRKEGPTFQTDIYSLGVTFFEILTGRLPFMGTSPDDLLRKHLSATPPRPMELNENITPEMEKLILRMLAKKTSERPKDVNEIYAELKRLKIFKQPVTEASKAAANEGVSANDRDQLMQLLSEARIDSRADVKIKEMLTRNPELAKEFTEYKKQQEEKKKAELERRRRATMKDEEKQGDGNAPVAVVPAAQFPAATPQPVPVQAPMQMPPGYMTYQPMPGPPMMVPQMPMMMPPMQAGYPGMPPQMMPPVPPGAYPQQAFPYPPAQVAAPVNPPQSPQVQPAQPNPYTASQMPSMANPNDPIRPNSPRARPEGPVVSQGPDEIDFMTELPDIM